MTDKVPERGSGVPESGVVSTCEQRKFLVAKTATET